MKKTVEVEKQSSILRKFTVKIPAEEVKAQFEKGLIAVQKDAKLKGFRPGQAPLSIIKQYYGDDVRHRVFHTLIDLSFDEAVRENQLKAVGRPKIDTPDHKTGAGEHDHSLTEDKDFTYIATFEVMPEVQVKNYRGISLTRDDVKITEEQVEQVVDNIHQSQAELIPAKSGLALADGTDSSRPVQKGDFVEFQLSGGLVTETGVVPREDFKGNRFIEVGGKSEFIPGLDDQLTGMRQGENKTFKVTFPADFSQADLASKEAEFSVAITEIKEKKLPELNDEFAKQMGYENLVDLRTKAKDYLQKEKTEEAERKLRSELLSALIEKNPFDVPSTLIEGQTRALAQDWAQELKKQGYDDKMIQNAIVQELEYLKTRAESQVRSSLILEAIAGSEKISVPQEELDKEIGQLAGSMRVEEPKLREYYAKNPGRMEDLEFRLRQERTLKFLLDNSKIA